jgi:hypothetical protein
MMFVAELEGRPIGSVRFDSRDGWTTARLSYVVAPESRGARLSSPLVAGGVAAFRAEHPTTAIRAEVRQANERSLRVFRGGGWREESVDGEVSRFWLD